MELPQHTARRHPQAETVPFVPRRLLIIATVRFELSVGLSDREAREALVALGLRPELVARFDRIMPLEPLNEAALNRVLVSSRGLLAGAQQALRALGGSIEYTTEAIDLIVKAASSDPHGAWALSRPVQRHLEEIFAAADPGKHWRVDEARARELVEGHAKPPKRGPYR
jgi:ATP-dependent protease Clp ATPase subunit